MARLKNLHERFKRAGDGGRIVRAGMIRGRAQWTGQGEVSAYRAAPFLRPKFRGPAGLFGRPRRDQSRARGGSGWIGAMRFVDLGFRYRRKLKVDHVGSDRWFDGNRKQDSGFVFFLISSFIDFFTREA